MPDDLVGVLSGALRGANLLYARHRLSFSRCCSTVWRFCVLHATAITALTYSPFGQSAVARATKLVIGYKLTVLHSYYTVSERGCRRVKPYRLCELHEKYEVADRCNEGPRNLSFNARRGVVTALIDQALTSRQP